MQTRNVNRGLRTSGRVMMLLMLAFFFVLFLITGSSFARIANTGMIHDRDLIAMNEERLRAVRSVESRRGMLQDRYGMVLANQHPAYTMFANFYPGWGSVIEDVDYTARQLSTVINMSFEEIRDNLNWNIAQGNRQSRFGHAGHRLSFLEERAIRELDLPGIDFQVELVRFHPPGVFASHTIGYTKFGEDGQLIGAMGIEYYFNDYLTGSDGMFEFQRDSWGFAHPGSERTYIEQPFDGYDIKLTLRSPIQVFLETAMDNLIEEAEPESIVAVVMNARTGEIYASGSRPSFDPNVRNPASYQNPLMYPFEPGSTFKIITYAAAINEGNYNGSRTFNSGQRLLDAYPADDIMIRDHPLIAARQRTFDEGFLVSTNTSTIDILREFITLHQFVDYQRAFGFGAPTGISLFGEHSGTLPNPDFSTIDVYMSSFGQAVTTTPIQILQATTAILNEGQMIKPQLIYEIYNPNDNTIVQSFEPEIVGTPIRASTAEQMRELMVGVVHSDVGTGREHYLLEIPSGGKTGTAEIPNPNAPGYLLDAHIYSYVGFAPAENPEIIMFVAVENPQTNQISGHPYAGALYRFVMNNTLSYLGFIRDEEDDAQFDLPEFQRVTVPNVLNFTADDAQDAVVAAGLTPFVIGNGATVFNQSPHGETLLIVDDKVFVQTEIAAALPSFRGWTRTQINQYARLMGLEIEIVGQGVGRRQTIRAGRLVEAGATLTVTLE